MFLVTLAFALIATTYGSTKEHIKPDGRIVGGLPIDITRVPYQAAALIDVNGNGLYLHSCGAIIVTRTALLTAAQCLKETRASQWRIRAGTNFHNSGGQFISVSSFLQHPLFNQDTLNNDIAIMYLSSELILGSSIYPISLPAQNSSISDGMWTQLTGWGVLAEGGSQPTQLYAVDVPTVNQQLCYNVYLGINTVTDNMVCAGRYGVGGTDACMGDAGGPMTINGVLYGIISWGVGCGRPNYPGVHVRVPVYRNWINGNT